VPISAVSVFGVGRAFLPPAVNKPDHTGIWFASSVPPMPIEEKLLSATWLVPPATEI